MNYHIAQVLTANHTSVNVKSLKMRIYSINCTDPIPFHPSRQYNCAVTRV